MHPRRITNALDAQLQALLDLHGAQGFKEFWRSARSLLHSALPCATIWFALGADWMPPSESLRAETAFETDADFERYSRRHPVRAFLLANPQRHLAALSDVMTDVQLLRSAFYRQLMAPQHERFSVVLSFWHRTSLRAVIGVTRLQNDRDFSAEELRTLSSLHSHLDKSLTNVRKAQRERSTHRALELLLAPLPLPIVALDWDLEILYHNRAAAESAELWVRGESDRRCFKPANRFALPPEVIAFCSELRTTWTQSVETGGRSSEKTAASIQHKTLPGLQASVRVMHLDPLRLGRPLLVVAFEHRNGQRDKLPRAAAPEFSQLARLTVREREVAALVCKGESNKEIAAHLGKSVLTVKAQLQSIYGKLGTDGRGKLISLLFEG